MITLKGMITAMANAERTTGWWGSIPCSSIFCLLHITTYITLYLEALRSKTSLYILHNGRTVTYHVGNLQAAWVNATTVIILLPILVPPFRKLPLQILELGSIFRNDKKVAYLHRRRWCSDHLTLLTLLWGRVPPKFVLHDRDDFKNLPTSSRSQGQWLKRQVKGSSGPQEYNKCCSSDKSRGRWWTGTWQSCA